MSFDEERAFLQVDRRRAKSEQRFRAHLATTLHPPTVQLCGETIESLSGKADSGATIFLSMHTVAYFLLFSLIGSSNKAVYVVVNRAIIEKFETFSNAYRGNIFFVERVTPFIVRALVNRSAHLFIMADVLVNGGLRSHVPFMERWLTYSINWARLVQMTGAQLCTIILLDEANGPKARCNFIGVPQGDIYECVHTAFSSLENLLNGQVDLWENYPVWDLLAESIVDTNSGWTRQIVSELYKLSAWNAEIVNALGLVDNIHPQQEIS
jgi:hypothetical protein